MSINLRIFSLLAILVYFVFLLRLVKKGTVMLKYTFMWLFAGMILTLFVIFPGLLFRLSALLGIETPSNALFTVCIGAIILIDMALTVIVSFQKKRLKMLAQSIALLEAEVAQLQENKESLC